MSSTTRTRSFTASPENTPALAWRAWPLVEVRPRTWLLILTIVLLGIAVGVLGGGWPLSVLTVVGLSAIYWQLFLPVDFEVTAHGLRRRTLGRTRLVPWHAIRAFQLRSGGIVLYQHSAPTKIDLARSMYIPYPSNADELLFAIRQHAAHAAEVSI